MVTLNPMDHSGDYTRKVYTPDDTGKFLDEPKAQMAIDIRKGQGQGKERKRVQATPYTWTAPESIPTREWLYGRHLIRKFVSATVAPGGVGKTSLAIVETLAMVTNRDLLNAGLHTGRLRVWYLNLEDPREEIVRQVQSACLHYGIEQSEIAGGLYVDSGREQEFVIADTQKDGAVICRPVVDSIIAELKARKIDVLVIDPLVSSHMVSENDNGAMDLVVKQWGKIADTANCAVHLIHHTRKSMGGEITAESSRGAKALTDGCRSVRAINRMTDNEAKDSGVKNPRLYFRAYNDKANLAPPSVKSDWFMLENVGLGNGGGGPDDKMGVVTTWAWPNAFDGVKPADLKKVQTEISKGHWRKSEKSDLWAGNAVAKVLELDLGNPPDKARVRSLIKEWEKNGALKVVEKEDKNRKLRPCFDVGEWCNE